MQSSRPFSDGGRQFGGGGARRRCPWLVYRELCQTTAAAAARGGWGRTRSEGIKRHGEGDKDGEQVEGKRLHGRGIDG